MTTRLGLVLVLALAALAPPAFAQSGPTGSLNGRVVDQSHAAVPGVAVTVLNKSTNDTRTGVTNDDGIYRVAALPVGTYELTFQLDGFKTIRRAGVLVEAAVPRTIDVQLEVGGLSEQVTVTVENPVLQRTTPAVARRLSSEEITSVPSSTRSFTHLLTATAGVSADLPPVGSNDTGAISPSVNGTKQTSNSVLYNGVDITSMLSNTGTLDEGLSPAPETIEEVKLQTSLYDASTGRSGGGNFQLVTKSGSNTLNGSLYAFGQNERFNSNDFFFEKHGIDKPKMRRVESGFTFGGPLHRDRAFFFGSLQRTDADTGYVPTASSRAVLPAALGLISGDRTPQNIVAAFRRLNPSFALQPENISPMALALLNARNPRTGDYLIPAPTGAMIGREPVVGIGAFTNAGGDPVAELRQVTPAEFQQLQGSARVDARVTDTNRLQVSYFGADFPSTDPFPDPSTLASPFPLRKSNRGHVASVGDTHIFGSFLNEARVGFFSLRNTRRLDDDISGVTSSQFGINNPALLFDDSAATRRLGHFVNRGITWSFGAPNDAFNRREQQTVHFSDVISATRGNHNIRIGGDFKLHNVRTNLPEEQGTEFEKIEHFQQFLLGFTSEADTQFGFTDKHFLMQDATGFVTDDWRVNDRLSLTMGLRWDWFGWPYEENGFFGNFDPALVTDSSNPLSAIIVPSNIQNSQFAAVNAGIAAVTRVDSKHTLNGQDLNNFAPRLGFAYTASEKHVIRGGYGLFYDRPSAAFMNTVFSNYPILREIEITVPSRQVPIQNAFSSNVLNGQPVPFDAFFPFRLVYSGTSGTYSIRDGTGGVGVNGGAGNIAETLEFRAVARDLQTPCYQQWNLGWQWAVAPSMAVEVRYNGSRGHNLLLATALNEPWDLNDPNTPQVILDRITAAYRAGGGTANQQDPNALGYGYNGDRNRGPAGTIPTEVRALYYGFNDAEALYLQSIGRSTYHALQTSVTKRVSKGYQFHAAYTYSVARDLMSADPGSTAGGGRPDTPNTGFSVENDSRNIEANWARSDFDRPHRFSLSGVWNLPLGTNVLLRDWEVATFLQFQSGRPFSVFRPEQGLLRLGFQRLDFASGATQDSVSQQAANPEEGWFDRTQLRAATAAGNTPRNFLRGPSQKRVDLSIARRIPFGSRVRVELRWEIFNVFNTVNFAMPENNFDSVDFGTITTTVGGPRVSQFGVRVTF
ncbi:MAG TPA: carboxypeptidase-like regulatory domain-containing protein [Vicinamibacterales bacterium]|nr:carboxypeptidase-like regulatory domain-containing protein [Vicinamibacterales bacterium]